jgi:hypothetical protein
MLREEAGGGIEDLFLGQPDPVIAEPPGTGHPEPSTENGSDW